MIEYRGVRDWCRLAACTKTSSQLHLALLAAGKVSEAIPCMAVGSSSVRQHEWRCLCVACCLGTSLVAQNNLLDNACATHVL